VLPKRLTITKSWDESKTPRVPAVALDSKIDDVESEDPSYEAGTEGNHLPASGREARALLATPRKGPDAYILVRRAHAGKAVKEERAPGD